MKQDMVDGTDSISMESVTKSSVRVLIVATGSAGLDAAQNTYKGLAAAGHQVTMASLDDWQTTLTDVSSEVVLLYPSADSHTSLQASMQLCRDIKNAPGSESAAIIVVLPASDSTHGSSWLTWQTAGADDLLNTYASGAEVEARVELLARFSRLSQQLADVREELSKNIQLDDVTQLMNRRFFFQAAHRECSRAHRYNHPLSCLMVEINYFDRLNHTFGYPCGDYVLRTVAASIRQWTRDSDIVARFGENKFVVLLPETDVEGAMIVREKLQRTLAENDFMWQEQKLPVTISIGEAERRWNPWASHDNEADTHAETSSISLQEELAELLEDADAALSIARKGVRCPEVFIEYSPAPMSLPESRNSG